MRIWLIGCGHMGSAMLEGWLRHASVAKVDVVDPRFAGHADARVHVHREAGGIKGEPDIVVLAVKPQMMDEVCAGLAPALDARVPVMSIAAGVTLARLVRQLGARPYMRAMPNTPGAIGQGVSGFHAEDCNPEQLDRGAFLLSALGQVVTLEREADINAVTALSGSGPAYVFALTEAMTKAGQACGLAADVAAALARQTVIGAAALMAQSADKSPARLRQAVTSPGGTTQAALHVLMRDGALDRLFEDAIVAAKKRADDLA